MAMATLTQQSPDLEQCLTLYDVSWQDYLRLGRLLRDRRLRLTYDRGTLEIMTLSSEHERWKHLLRRLVEVLSEELHIKIAGFGSMTCRRRKKRRGLEPDECYWVANEPLVRGKIRINLRVDPPPDLAMEVDYTSSSLDRMSIYKALAVPELWRFDGRVLEFFGRQSDGKYLAIPTSLAFPGVTAADVLRFLQLCDKEDENSIVRTFRAWVRQRSGAGGQSP
jgi:Uma2 family endonuclease